MRLESAHKPQPLKMSKQYRHSLLVWLYQFDTACRRVADPSAALTTSLTQSMGEGGGALVDLGILERRIYFFSTVSVGCLMT